MEIRILTDQVYIIEKTSWFFSWVIKEILLVNSCFLIKTSWFPKFQFGKPVLESHVNHFILNTFYSSAFFSYLGIQSLLISSKIVSDFTLNIFPSSAYFRYFGIQSRTISSQMVSNFTLNIFPSSVYFRYLGIKLITISGKMVILV